MNSQSEYEFLNSLRTKLNNGITIEEKDKVIAGLLDIIDAKNDIINETASALKKSEEEMKRIDEASKRDALTGLYNRKAELPYFKEQLRKLNEEGNEELDSLHVVAIDLDHFKSINDTYGHDVGDDALIIVARGIENSFRRKDLVVREGGDEFLIIAKNIALSTLNFKLQQMADTISNNINKDLDCRYQVVDGEKVSITRPYDYTVSYGVCEMNLSELNEDLINNPESFNQWFAAQKKSADDASYNMKKSHHANTR